MSQTYTRRFRRAYRISLFLIALLSIGGQGLLYRHLEQSQVDESLINTAGRQRMLSQRMMKAALLLAAGHEEHRTELEESLRSWSDSHEHLRALSQGTSWKPPDSLDVSHQRMTDHVRALLQEREPEKRQEALLPLLADEALYLTNMDALVYTLEVIASQQQGKIRVFHLLLLLAIFGVLLTEGLLIFRPVVLMADTEITRRAEAEQSLVAQAAELRQAVREAQAASQARDRFLSTMSHELRTPLNGISGMLEVMDRFTLPSGAEECLQTIRSSANTQLRLIDDALTFSRLQSSPLQLFEHRFSLRPTIREVTQALQPRVLLKGLTLKVDVSAETPDRLRGDPLRLRQVLQHLLSNAIKFTDQGEITLSVESLPASEPEREQLTFRVSDAGIGIPPEAQSRVFEPFTQVSEQCNRPHDGAGLGLAICRRIIESMGGRIGVQSVPGRGSIFWFTIELPRIRQIDGLRILIVEDDANNRVVLQELLKQLGHEVLVAEDGSTAVALLRANPLDLILMGTELPELDGFEATRLIRAMPMPVSQIPIAGLAAFREVDRQRCFAVGMNDILGAPLTLAALSGLIRQLTTQEDAISILSREGPESAHSLALPPEEQQRIDALRRLAILDTEPEERFDRITRVAMALFRTPTALFSLVDTERLWFKSRQGFDALEMPRNISLCSHAISADQLLVIPDAQKDPRFSDNPLVASGQLAFYAGSPVHGPSGHRLGSLCILDQKAQTFSREQERLLTDLSKMLESELRLVELEKLYREVEAAALDRVKREQVERLVRQQQEAQFFHNVPAAIAILDRELRYLAVTRRWLEDYRLGDQELIGRSHYEVFPEIPEEWRAILRRGLAGERLSREEDRFKRADGSVDWVRWSIHPWYEPDGSLGGIMLFTELITERKRTWEELRRREDELQQAQKMEVVGRLSAGIAHDFNNLLTAILGFTHLALMDLSPDTQVYEDLQEIQEAGERGARLTRQLLTFSRQEPTSVLRIVLIDTILKGMQRLLKRVIRGDQTLMLVLGASEAPVLIEPSKLEQAVLNLVINASDAIPEVGTITIQTRSSADGVTLSVSDDGEGIPTENLERIFEPFFTTKAAGQGTGLGLATVAAIVAEADGDIKVSSCPKQGTRFDLVFPIYSGSPDATQIHPSDKELDLRGVRVLLVESNDPVRRLTERLLSHAGATVRALMNGREALDHWEEEAGGFDLLIIDILLPRFGGLALARRMRERAPEVPILFLAGGIDAGMREAVENMFGTSLLSMPLEPAQLFRESQRLLSERSCDGSQIA